MLQEVLSRLGRCLVTQRSRVRVQERQTDSVRRIMFSGYILRQTKKNHGGYKGIVARVCVRDTSWYGDS